MPHLHHLGDDERFPVGTGQHRIAGNDLPDAFNAVGFSNYDLTKNGEDGVFIDLTPYITEEYMPNLTKILEEHPDIRAAITMDDGCIYGLPRRGTDGHRRYRQAGGLQHLHHPPVFYDQQDLAG